MSEQPSWWKKSLDDLEGGLGPPTYDSCLVSTIHRLHAKRLCDFTVEDLRIMIGQGLGLAYLIPAALPVVESKPLSSGDMYPGDLLAALLRVDSTFWRSHRALHERLVRITTRLGRPPDELKEALASFHRSTV